MKYVHLQFTFLYACFYCLKQNLAYLRCTKTWTSSGQTTGPCSQVTTRSASECALRTLRVSSSLLQKRISQIVKSGKFELG